MSGMTVFARSTDPPRDCCGQASAGPQGARKGAAMLNIDGRSTRKRLTEERRSIAPILLSDGLMALDGIWIVVSAVATKEVLHFQLANSDALSTRHFAVSLVAAFLTLIIFRGRRLYEVDELGEPTGRIREVLQGFISAVALTLALGFLLKVSGSFSRIWFVTWVSVCGIGLLALHSTAAGLLNRIDSRGLLARRVAIYGAGGRIPELLNRLALAPSKYAVLGVFDDTPPQNAGLPIAGGLDDLVALCQSQPVDEIIMSMSTLEQEKFKTALDRFSALPLAVRFCPPFSDIAEYAKGLVRHQGITLIEVLDPPLRAWDLVIKRTEDIVVGSLALFFFAIPLALAAIAIKLESKGPVFFRQERLGFNGQRIRVWKLRTMREVETGEAIVQATRRDPRITRVGKFLRMTSVDELPQLLNVIRGEMSLVGPRPYAIAHDEAFKRSLPTFVKRYKVKPGMTGWAQINGLRGEISSDMELQARLEYDLFYLEHWSIWFDMKVLGLTPVYGFVNRNAY